MNKIPTTEEIKEAREKYRSHLKGGGAPAQIVVTVWPAEERDNYGGLDLKVDVLNMPNEPLNKFVEYLEYAIGKAIAPPGNPRQN